MRNWLKNKTIILTGASGGIGRELTKLLIQKYGANVIGIGRNEEKMLSLSAELAENASRFSYRLFDVADKTAWQAFANDLQENHIRPNLLINNAGVFPSFSKTCDMTAESVERVLSVNFFSAVYAEKAISPLLVGEGKDKSAIVNIASSAALCTVVGTSAYSASKAALKSYTEAMQLEERGKRYIGLICPGTTATDLFRNDDATKDSALYFIAMPAKKMARKIARKILKKRKRGVLGWDAKAMNFMARLAPVRGVGFICRVMKASHSKVFNKVFNYKNKD